MRADSLPIGGLVPMTTVDFPGHLAAVVFCQGCPWRCPYCHNPDLQPLDKSGNLSWESVKSFLEERSGFLEGVVFSGGEPTIHSGLPSAMAAAHAMGLLVGLHSAGMAPERLAQALPFTDWLGLDIKAPLDGRYDRISGHANSAARVIRSLEAALASGVSLQLRTTVDPGLLSKEDLADLSADLQRRGAPAPVIQQVRPGPLSG
jgi:pyruvate formate lyase activating enzyme